MRSLIALLALLPALSGCALLGGEDCQESACDAVRRPHKAGTLEQGVVGVIAYRTDACEQDCCECSLADAELDLSLLDEPATSEADALAAVAHGSSVGFAIKVHGPYEQALEVGDYLLCYGSKCAALHIQAGDVFTVNLQLRYGPPSVIVFAPKDSRQRDDLVFETNKE